MTPVFQTNDWNCFAAAVASILNLKLSQVPRKMGDDWFAHWRRWLAKRGLGLERIMHLDGWSPKGWSVLSVDRETIDQTHAVVCFDGEIVHDPASDLELVKRSPKRRWFVITVLDAGKALKPNAKGV